MKGESSPLNPPKGDFELRCWGGGGGLGVLGSGL
jgi:hypothetical protein